MPPSRTQVNAMDRTFRMKCPRSEQGFFQLIHILKIMLTFYKYKFYIKILIYLLQIKF